MKKMIKIMSSENSSATFDKIKSELQQEASEYVNSIYEQTDAGEYVSNLITEAEDRLGMYSEDSVQGGQGGVWIYDEDNEIVAENIDYDDYCDEIVEVVLESTSREDAIDSIALLYDQWIEY